MQVEAIEIELSDFKQKEAKITAILKQFNDFTSPRYQSHAIISESGKALIIKPKQPHFVAALNENWKVNTIKVQEEL